MPTVYTHYKFGQDVLNKFSKKQRDNISENILYYNMYNQGFDNLYYHFKWQYYRKFGVRCHKNNFDIFIKNIVTYIKENNITDSTITNFLYGIINHYTLDTIVHPYINYQVDNLNIPHSKIEFMFDYYLYFNEHKKWNNKLYKTLMPKFKFSNELKNFLNAIFEITYNEKNIGKVFNRSHNNGYYIYRFFISDQHNIKSKLYRIIDLFLFKCDFKLHNLTFNKEFDKRILNEENNNWLDYNYSLLELYNYSFNIALKVNEIAYKVINDKENIETLLENIRLINIKNIPKFLG